jgi:PAS domain S-box-containing protein
VLYALRSKQVIAGFNRKAAIFCIPSSLTLLQGFFNFASTPNFNRSSIRVDYSSLQGREMSTTNTELEYASQAPPLAYFTNVKRGGLLVGASPFFWVIFCGVVLISAIIAGTGLVVSSFRDREIHRSERELENTVHLLAGHFDRQIESFESIHKSVATEIERRVKTPDEFRSILSTEEVHRLLRNKISDSVDFAGVNLFDSDGVFINSSERWPVPSLNLSDRKYFKTFKADSNSSPVLIELVESRVAQGRTIVIARKILGANGEFLGMVNNMAQALLLFDRSERLVICNKRYVEMFGLSSELAKPGCKLRDLIQHRKDNGSLLGDVDEYCESVRRVCLTKQRAQNLITTPDGRWMQVVHQPLADGGWVSTIEDVTEQHHAEERTVRLACTTH